MGVGLFEPGKLHLRTNLGKNTNELGFAGTFFIPLSLLSGFLVHFLDALSLGLLSL